MTLNDYIKQTGITLTSSRVARNPQMDGSDQMDNYRVTLRQGNDGTKRRITVYFSKGFGLNGTPPEANEVLDCLASDAAGYENAQSFEDWASEYGYDVDSRKAERTFKQVEKLTDRLKAFLGHDYQQVLFDMEER